MEHESQTSTHTEVKAPAAKQPNPARKWLIVSLCGLIVCLGALGYRALTGGSSTPQPLPSKVLKQVFGFTPYYFTKDIPPARLKLKADTPKFFGNALSFTLVSPKNQTVTITQKTLPTDYSKAAKGDDKSLNTVAGTATVSAVQGGRIEATLITKDNTLITVESKEILNSGTIQEILESLIAIDKLTGLPVQQ